MLCSPPPGMSSKTTTKSQTIPSQGPATNNNDEDDLSETEIRILKSKLVKDNDLDGLLELENKIESSLENTIESRLEKDNLIQESPGEIIDMSHLTTDIQQILHNLITTYKEAFSVNKFDIGKFLGFPTGITLDVREGMSA